MKQIATETNARTASNRSLAANLDQAGAAMPVGVIPWHLACQCLMQGLTPSERPVVKYTG